MLNSFSSYDYLKDHSSDIVVARCITNPPTLFNSSPSDPQINTFSIAIVAVIKGTNFFGSASLITEQWLNQGDSYLIYGQSVNGVCQAYQDFRVIPLGRELYIGQITNAIAGKLPDQQLQILFKRAVNNLNWQMKKEQEEKQRLEEVLAK